MNYTATASSKQTKITILNSAIKIAQVSNHKRKPVKHNKAQGWSMGATRRLRDFLASVEYQTIAQDYTGVSLTLTYPSNSYPNPKDFHSLLDNYQDGLKYDYGRDIMFIWVVEWTRAKTPHIHAVLFVKTDTYTPYTPLEVRERWLKITAKYGTVAAAQYIKPIFNINGWFKYLRKHSVRGLKHYQRNKDNIPTVWLSGTGKLWGKTRNMIVSEPQEYYLEPYHYHQIRRALNNYTIAIANTALKKNLSRSKPFELQSGIKTLVYARRRFCVYQPERIKYDKETGEIYQTISSKEASRQLSSIIGMFIDVEYFIALKMIKQMFDYWHIQPLDIELKKNSI